ncbi:hypothetical protein FJ527_23000 [Mesorhizobium sp. B2-4-18]|uniref:hypothetical protein n=2 Tax=unclassified Mesorhizobium TaxID=325217 RepID=UPI00112883D6|nr:MULTISPECIES: hypothetical protein [unclassified Mesorhizobium]MBZ9723677.1 hypothetical protein [Mesorhizobium sp. CO1-1-11]TPK73260.1 hypothetical protein FJ527_23000 [Mesorhizobium sp. B2-4-18]
MLLPHPTDWPLLFYGDPWLTSRSPDRVAPQRHDLALAGYLEKQAANREAMNRRPGLLGRLIDKIRQRFGKQAVGYGTVALEAARSLPDAFRN